MFTSTNERGRRQAAVHVDGIDTQGDIAGGGRRHELGDSRR
jgi:hypothetical protein